MTAEAGANPARSNCVSGLTEARRGPRGERVHTPIERCNSASPFAFFFHSGEATVQVQIYSTEDMPAEWSLVVNVDNCVRAHAGLCWDEMIGQIARIGLKQIGPIPNWPDRFPVPDSYLCLTVTNTDDGCLWCVEREFRFLDHLTFDEMLGFVAAYTLIGRENFGGMKTYEQFSRSPWWQARRRERPPVAMLEVAR